MHKIALLASLAILTSILPQSASACSCEQRSRQELRSKAEASFNGRVISVERLGEPFSDAVKATVEVVWPFKGAPASPITLYSGYDGGLCGSGRELFEARRTGEIWEFNISANMSDSKTPLGEMQVGYCTLRPMEFGARQLGRRARGLTDR